MIQGQPAPQPVHSSVNEMLAGAVRSEAGLTFVDMQEEETTVSWRHVYLRARRAAQGLVQLGVRTGDRVGIAIPTSPELMEAFFGVLLAGAVPAMLHPLPRAGRLEDHVSMAARMLQSVGTRLLLAHPDTLPAFRRAAEIARVEFGCHPLQPFIAEGETEIAVGPEALGLIQFTSGSTGAPKPIALSHRSLVMHSAMLTEVFREGSHPGDKMVSWLPLYHDMGLIGCLLYPLYSQIPVILMAPEVFITKPLAWLRAISRHGGTLAVAPNFAYELCVRRARDQDVQELQLHTLRRALNGAEPVSVTTMEMFSRRFAPSGLKPSGVLRPVYGLAEVTLGVAHTPPRDIIRRVNVDSTALAREGRVVEGTRPIPSVGFPIPGVQIAIRDEVGEDLPERRVGRIHVRTASPMQGYFGNAEATRSVLRDGWLDTGDLGFFDQGELFVCGRAKELVIIRGANHPPQYFEECLEGLEGVRPGCVVAAGFIPEGSESEELLILAERRGSSDAGDPVLEKKIRQLVLERTGIRPHTVRLLPKGTLRRTTSGKLRRQDALQRFLAGELAPPARTQPEPRPGAVATR